MKKLNTAIRYSGKMDVIIKSFKEKKDSPLLVSSRSVKKDLMRIYNIEKKEEWRIVVVEDTFSQSLIDYVNKSRDLEWLEPQLKDFGVIDKENLSEENKPRRKRLTPALTLF